MYVKRILYDEWRNSSNVEVCIENPTWQEVEKVIDMLDGNIVTQITIDNGNEDNYLCIGGGNSGLCNVFISQNDNEIIYGLIKRCFNPAVNHRLVTGGQESEFEDKECVPIDTAKCVAKRYYDSGERDESFSWE